MKCLLLFSTGAEGRDVSHRPSRALKQILQSDVGEGSVAASSFQEWRAITDSQRGTSRTHPGRDGVQDVRLIMMGQDTPGIAAAPVGGRTHATFVVPLEIWWSLFNEIHDIKGKPEYRKR